jgi:hypothetical protein
MNEHQSQDQTAIRTDLGVIFVSLELSRSTWLITSLSPGAGERLSKHSVLAGDIGSFLARFAQLQQKAAARLGRSSLSSQSRRPASALSRWFFERVQRNGSRMRKTTIVALARKLLVAFWNYVTSGVVIEGAVMQAA